MTPSVPPSLFVLPDPSQRRRLARRGTDPWEVVGSAQEALRAVERTRFAVVVLGGGSGVGLLEALWALRPSLAVLWIGGTGPRPGGDPRLVGTVRHLDRRAELVEALGRAERIHRAWEGVARWSARPRTALVVDQEEPRNAAIRRSLEGFGWEAEGSTSAHSALERLALRGFASILTQPRFPGIGTEEWTELLRRMTSGAPVLVLDAPLLEALEQGDEVAFRRALQRAEQGGAAGRGKVESVFAALERGELFFHYQGQFTGDGEEAEVVEALLRWEHPRRGLLRPGAFLDAVEPSMGRLGVVLLRMALADLGRMREAGVGARLAVNVAPCQLTDPRFADQVARALDEAGLEGADLEVEITERSLVRDTSTVALNLAALRARGVRIAIDDFGAGYSTLSYLARFHVDTLKLDGCLVRGMGCRRGQVVVRAIVELAHELGIEVVAEFVETERQRDRLCAIGVDRLQGHLFGEPAPLQRWLGAPPAGLRAVG